MKILHSADWHLDSPFASFDGEPRAFLQQAQRRIPERLRALCAEEHCDLVLLAGDIFDGPYSRETAALLADALETVRTRAGSQTSIAEGSVSLTYGQILLKNLGVYANAAGLLLLLALVVLLGYLMLKKGYRFRVHSGLLVSLGATALIPFLWYWMTHRNLSITILAITSLISFSLHKNGGAKHG